MMMWGYGYGGAWWMVLIYVLITVLIAAIVVAVIYVSRAVTPSHRGGASNARSILEERFARGEIDEDEFKRRLTALG